MDLHKELPILHVDAPQPQHNLFDDAYSYGQKLLSQVHESAVKHPNISVAVAAPWCGGNPMVAEPGELAELVITETQQASNALIRCSFACRQKLVRCCRKICWSRNFGTDRRFGFCQFAERDESRSADACHGAAFATVREIFCSFSSRSLNFLRVNLAAGSLVEGMDENARDLLDDALKKRSSYN